MRRRHLALPRLWLLTDERQGDALWEALARLPRGSGVVVRHYSLSLGDRAVLMRRVRRLGRGLVVAWAGRAADAERLGADAVYGAGVKQSRLPKLAPVHDRAEIVAAERGGAALLILSPVFPTRSHPGAPVLGVVRFGLLSRAARRPVLALGGMNAARWRRVGALGAGGWAGIDRVC